MLKPACTLLSLSLVLITRLAAQTYTNPVFGAADPWIAHENGIYYFSGGCGLAGICVRSSPTLEGLRKGQWHTVFTGPATGPNNADVWAPEIHKVNGHWYLYYAADQNRDNPHHKLFVAQADTDDPIGHYSMANTGLPNGQLNESSGQWAIDPNVFTASDGHLYLTWSCSNLAGAQHPQKICLARMGDPLHIDGKTVEISTPTEPWEMRAAPIEEGPVGYVYNGKTYITFSGSASWNPNDYSVGLLTHTSGDLLNPFSWVKTGPILDHHDTAYGTGSVVFVQAPDGAWWNFYHGIDKLTCAPAYSCRDTRMQPMTWQADGAPLLGYPYDLGVAIPEPSTGYRELPGAWGPAFGDAAEGNAKAGLVVGEWENHTPASNQSLTLGSKWMQTFLRQNPNLEKYTLSADMQLIGTGGDSPAPRYGVYAAYSDVQNFVSVWIDPAAKTVSTYAIVGGAMRPWAACPLPASFNAQQSHTLGVQKSGDAFTISVDRSVLTGACNTRKFGLLNGQVGLLTEDARVRFRNISVH